MRFGAWTWSNLRKWPSFLPVEYLDQTSTPDLEDAGKDGRLELLERHLLIACTRIEGNRCQSPSLAHQSLVEFVFGWTLVVFGLLFGIGEYILTSADLPWRFLESSQTQDRLKSASFLPSPHPTI